jgi:hypothetical protein
MEANAPLFSIVHTTWSALLTVVGGLLTMFVRNNRIEMDRKADKDVVNLQFSSVDQKLNAIKELAENRSRRVEELHEENKELLCDIARELRIR